jgi:hypothetical protein
MNDDARRVVKMTLAAALAGSVLIVLVRYLVLPALVRSLTRAKIDWLRGAFSQHPVGVLAAIVTGVALLGIPVLLAALWAGQMGPWRSRRLKVTSRMTTRSHHIG